MKQKANENSRLRFSTALFKGAYVHNPVLTQLSGLCTVVMAATSIRYSLYISLTFSLLLFICEALASAFLKSFPRWVRVSLYAVICSAAIVPVMLKMNPESSAALGVYLPLLCVNAIIVIRCEKFSLRTGVVNSVLDAAAAAVGFSAVTMAVGTVREILSSGKLFSVSVLPENPQAAMPFAGLAALGFLAAVHKWSIMKFFPQEIVDTFNMRDAFEKPVLSDPGLHSESETHKKSPDSGFAEIRPRYSAEDVPDARETASDAENAKRGTEEEKEAGM